MHIDSSAPSHSWHTAIELLSGNLMMYYYYYYTIQIYILCTFQIFVCTTLRMILAMIFLLMSLMSVLVGLIKYQSRPEGCLDREEPTSHLTVHQTSNFVNVSQLNLLTTVNCVVPSLRWAGICLSNHSTSCHKWQPAISSFSLPQLVQCGYIDWGPLIMKQTGYL